MKNLISKAISILFAPLRKAYVRRNGVLSTKQRTELPNDTFLSLVSESLRKGHSAVIWVKGYSMRPFIESGRDKVKLTAMSQYGIGDAVLAQTSPGHYVLHRIIGMNGHLVTLQGDGNTCGIERCTIGDICGVIVEYIRPNRVIPATDKQLCRRIKLWRMLRPVRRPLLFAYKSILN